MSSLRTASSMAVCAAFCLFAALPAIAAATTQKPVAHSSTAAEPAPFTVEVINGASRVIRSFNTPAPSTTTRQHAVPTPAGTPVEVINGEAQRTVLLNSQPEQTVARRHAPPRRKGQPAPKPAATAEILNGARRETRVFSGPDAFDASAPAHRAFPVVIGVASSTAQPVVVGVAVTNSQAAQPVVLRIASSGSQSEIGTTQPVVVGIESSGLSAADAEPVAIGIAPRTPKRAPYRRPTPSP